MLRMRSCAQSAPGVARLNSGSLLSLVTQQKSLLELALWHGLIVGLFGYFLLTTVPAFALALPAQYKSVTPYTALAVSTYLTNMDACIGDAIKYTSVSGPYYLGNPAAASTTCIGTNNGTNWLTLFSVSIVGYCPATTGWTISGQYPNQTCTGTCAAGTTLISDSTGYQCATPPPKDNGQPSCSLVTSNPVHTGTGNKFQYEFDYAQSVTNDGLSFARYYNSRRPFHDKELGHG